MHVNTVSADKLVSSSGDRPSSQVFLGVFHFFLYHFSGENDFAAMTQLFALFWLEKCICTVSSMDFTKLPCMSCFLCKTNFPCRKMIFCIELHWIGYKCAPLSFCSQETISNPAIYCPSGAAKSVIISSWKAGCLALWQRRRRSLPSQHIWNRPSRGSDPPGEKHSGGKSVFNVE